jgi:hypothetical protein
LENRHNNAQNIHIINKTRRTTPPRQKPSTPPLNQSIKNNEGANSVVRGFASKPSEAATRMERQMLNNCGKKAIKRTVPFDGFLANYLIFSDFDCE